MRRLFVPLSAVIAVTSFLLGMVASGGRVLCVTALGHNVKTAQQRAYEFADTIRFDGMQMRRDIGHRAVTARRS